MNGCRRLCLAAILVGVFSGIGHVPTPAHAQNQAESLAASFRKAVERVAPAVVAVRPIDPNYPLAPVPNTAIGPIRSFEGGRRLAFRVSEPDRELLGSGVVVDAKNGYILTNDHVLLGSAGVAVILADGRQRIASQVRRDPGIDLAVLVIDPAGLNLVQAKLGDPNALRPGDWVVSVGQSGGATPVLSSGIYSSRRRGPGTPGGIEEWLETDAAVNSLNSGGPLVNLEGEVVGINTASTGRGTQVAGMGFAIPADRARRVATDLIVHGRVRRAYLGVHIEGTMPASSGRLAPGGSVVVASVTPATPAAQAGIRPGDRVVAVAGRPVTGPAMLQGLIEVAPVDENLTVTIERSGKRQDIVVRPAAQPATAGSGLPMAGQRIQSEARQDVTRGRVRGREPGVVSQPAPPLPAPSAGENAPSSLDPIPRTEPPAAGPSLELSPNPSGGPREGATP